MQKQLKRHLHRNYFWSGREKQYKNIIPRIIVEPFIEDSVFHELRDYKFFVFDGKVKFMYIASNRQSNKETCFDFFDCNFRHLPFTNGHPNSSVLISKPIHFDLMIELAEVLAQKIPFVRIDFYEANNQVYFGEYTFSHFSGFIPFNPETWDNKIGQYLSLTKCYE